MEQTPTNQSEVMSKCREIPLMLCHQCNRAVPKLLLKPFEGKMNISLKCTCSEKEREMSLHQFIDDISAKQAEEFKCTSHQRRAERSCIGCSEWLCQECMPNHWGSSISKDQVLKENEQKAECKLNIKQNAFFCCQCSLSLGEKSHPDHLKHIVVSVQPIEPSEPQLSELEKAMDGNRRRKDKLIERIDNQIVKLTQTREEIQSLFNANDSINRDLAILHQSICRTSAVFKGHTSFELKRLQETFILSTEDKQADDDIEEEFFHLKDHLINHFILKQTNECLATLTEHRGCPCCLVSLKDGRLASASSDKTIKIWNTFTQECKATITQHSQWVQTLIQLQDGLLLSWGYDHSLFLWDTSTFQLKYSLYNFNFSYLIQLKDGRLAYVYGVEMTLWNLLTNERTKVHLPPNTSTYYQICCFVELKDFRLAIGCHDGKMRLKNMKTGECKVVPGHDSWVVCLVVMKDGRLASGSYDATIKLWNMERDDCMATLTGHSDFIECLMELEDGRLVSGSRDKTIKLWNPMTNECKATLIGHSGIVYSLSQLPDNRLASGSDDKTIKIWNV